MNAIAILMLGAALVGGGEEDQKKPELRVKAAVSVRGMDVRIGDVCEIKPANATTAAIAQLRFGPAPTNGYARTITRTDLIQTLSAAGVQLATVQLAGADESVVQAICVDVSPNDMLDAARAALQAVLSVETGDVEFTPPGDLRYVKAPPGRVSQDLRARVRNNKTGPNSAVVDVEILVDGECFKKVPLTFKLQRYQMVLKTLRTIAKDSPLGPDNVVLVREPLAQATGMFLSRPDQILGMNARTNLQPDRLLTLGDIMPPAVIRRGDIVTVVLTKGRVKVTSRAMANEDAPLNERITLTNLTSRGLLTGIVTGPGLVVVPQ
ncbi:MAG: flagellar basal body P-ring formation chaperone FlgA [Planctomycetota bacterium]